MCLLNGDCKKETERVVVRGKGDYQIKSALGGGEGILRSKGEEEGKKT